MLDRANSTLNHMNAAFKDDQSLEALIEQLEFQVSIIRQQNIHDRVSLGLDFRSKEHQQPVRRLYDFLKLAADQSIFTVQRLLASQGKSAADVVFSKLRSSPDLHQIC